MSKIKPLLLSLMIILSFQPNLAIGQTQSNGQVSDGMIGNAAQNQILQALVGEVNKLKSDLLQVQRQVYQGGGVQSQAQGQVIQSPNAAALMDTSVAGSLQIKIQQIESDIRQLYGRLEEINFRTQSLADQLTTLNQDLQFRLERLEGTANPNQPAINQTITPQNTGVSGNTSQTDILATAGVNAGGNGEPMNLGTLKQEADGTISGTTLTPNPASLKPENAGANTNVNQSPKEAYDQAINQLNQREFQAAEILFKSFLAKWPKDDLAGNARYWLGESYYVRAQFELAVNEFIDTYTSYSNSPKAPAALLKLALSLDQIKRRDTACEALATLKQQYPNAEDYILKRGSELQKTYACS